MNITLVVDQRYSYKEALKIAYDKARQEGGLDAETEASCQAVFSDPGPAAVYHEADMIYTGEQPSDGGIYFMAWNLREVYEQARINGRRCMAEAVASELGNAVNALSQEFSMGDDPDQRVNFTVDEDGAVTAIAPKGSLADSDLKRLGKMLNEAEDVRRLAYRYALLVASLAHCTVAGLDAHYARHYARSVTGS